MSIDTAGLQVSLEAWAGQFWSESSVAVDNIVDMSGHSGKVIGFDATESGKRHPLVVRLAPEGVPHRGSTDVLRQAPLLKALHAQGLKAPAVVDANGDESLFGVPYLMMQKLPGKPLVMGPDAGPSWLPDAERQQAYNLAAELLASLHCFDVDKHLQNWEEPKGIQDELDMWTVILEKGKEQAWIQQGEAVRDALKASAPNDYHVGLLHGDFQTNNVLFEHQHGELVATGVVDWEIANIGPTALDLAWFLMMNDSQAWHPVECRGGVDLDAVVAAYESVVGHATPNLNWFWALACYRIAAIAALNIRLHRTGRKHDPAWERAAQSVPIMFSRALQVLGQ